MDENNFSSNDLIPHPSTEYPAGTPPVPQSEQTAVEELTLSPQLTAEMYATGTIPPGTMLGQFRIKSFIGGGGMGRVYLATDTVLDRNVAVKVLPRSRANDAGIVARFMNEAKSAARLNNEHISQIYFVGQQDGIPFIIFEYVEGTNVRSLVEDNDTLPLAQALNYLIQLANALVHAAEHGVVHRDVKPSNILITREGRAKLIDMGLARLLVPDNRNDDLTASGVTLGTFDYISPEQARDPRNADIRSDIYSLGCTFFFMLAGRPPFPEGTVLQKLLQHQGDEPPDIRTFQPSIPAEIAQLIQKMMAKDPRQRFQTPTLLVDALVRTAKMLGLQPAGQSKLMLMMNQSARTAILLRHIPWASALLILFAVYLPLSLYWGWSDRMEIPQGLTKVLAETELLPAPVQPSAGNTAKNVETVSPVKNNTGTQENLPPFTLVSTVINGKDGAALSPQKIEYTWQTPTDSITAFVSATDFVRERQTGSIANTAAADILNKPSVLCVDPAGTTPESFKTLESALSAANKGDTVLLKWNGIEKFKPIVLSDRQLKIAAADGYQPVLRFEPADNSAISFGPRTVLSVRSSSLEFRNIGIEFQIRQDEMGLRWTFFDLAGGNTLRFIRCDLTVFNTAADNSAYHQDAVFFRNSVMPNVSEPVFDISAELRENTNNGQLTLDLTDSIVRGEAYCLRNDAPQNIVVSAKNTIFALANPFIQDDDTGKKVLNQTAYPAVNPAKIQIRFNLVTYFGLLPFAKLIKNSAETNPLPLEMNVKQSVFIFNGNPLSVFSGEYADRNLLQLFRWNGEQNWFQDIRTAFRFQSAASSAETGTNEVSLPDWLVKTFPETADGNSSRPKLNGLIFSEIRKPVSQVVWSDLVPSFPPDSPLSSGEIQPFGASQPGAFMGTAESPAAGNSDANRLPLDSDYGRLIFEKK
ncbi:hypothetical protein FACS189427_02980 [Planctomycetales bacterium]|nr:hypothetical protein FACS189427_02980 [Planctomycetales bacterium]